MTSTVDCIFCKIIAGSMAATIIAQNDAVMVIKDIFPKAPIHYLIISKKHIPSIQSLDPSDVGLVSSAVLMAKELALTLNGSQDFRLLENDGPGAGQSVFHLHFHFLAGRQMHDF